MTRSLDALAAFAALACGCGNSGGSGVDAPGGGGDGDGGNETGDGLGAGAHTIEVTLTNRPNNAAAFSFVVAYQDGSAPWKLAPAPTGDTYTFDVSAPSYGVAYACVGNVPGGSTTPTQVRSVNLAHFAVAERTSLTLEVPSRCSDRFGGTVTLSGTITNRPMGGVLAVQYGTRTVFAGNQFGGFAMQVAPGTHDLVVVHAVPQGNGDFYIDESLVIRDLAVNGATSKSIDFAEAETTASYDVDINVDMERAIATTVMYTANGTQGTITRMSNAWESDALPASQRRATDIYDQAISVSSVGNNATISNATSTPGPQVWVEPAGLGDVTSTIPTKQPYMVVESSWSDYPEAIGYTWIATQGDTCSGVGANCTTTWTALLSPGVTGTTPSYRMPDLSDLTGWKAAFEFVGTQPIEGSVTAARSTAGPSDFPTGIPADGTKRVFVRSDYGAAP